MKKLRIYTDTSVIGGCFDLEFAPWSNGLFEDFRRSIFKPVLSEVVKAELESAPNFVLEKFAELLSLDPEFVPLTDETMSLAKSYQNHGILRARFSRDLLHIALATIAEVDVLVSWNFKHIVRLDKIRLFNAVNIELGYKPLTIYSPREVTTYEKE